MERFEILGTQAPVAPAVPAYHGAVEDSPGIVFLGHATVVVEIGGLRVLTDPVLRPHLAFLERQTTPLHADLYAGIDVVLVSHLHWDHLDLPSLRRLAGTPEIVVPRGAGPLLARRGFGRVHELDAGGSMTLGDLRVTATPARVPPPGRAPARLLRRRHGPLPGHGRPGGAGRGAAADLGLGPATRARPPGPVSGPRSAAPPPPAPGRAAPPGGRSVWRPFSATWTGAKLRRGKGVGPRRWSASRWSAVA